MSATALAQQAARRLRAKVLGQMLAGVGVVTVPVGVWWYWARRERQAIQQDYQTRVRIPNVTDTYDYLIAEKCQAGDVLLFDRRCERCAASPWAALACVVAKQCLTRTHQSDSEAHLRAVDAGSYDHVGLIVPGYVTTRSDEFDPTNLLLLEATASGIVARPLKQRLEQSAAHSVLLLPLCSPGEQRHRTSTAAAEDDPHTANVSSSAPSSQQMAVARTRKHVEDELRRFRDQWIRAGAQQHYHYLHSTVTLGGALAHVLGLQAYTDGPVSPSAFLVVAGLQQAAAAPAVSAAEQRSCRPSDFRRDSRCTDRDVVRLRPGWRFLAPIPLKQASRSGGPF